MWLRGRGLTGHPPPENSPLVRACVLYSRAVARRTHFFSFPSCLAGPHGQQIAQHIRRAPDGSPLPSLATVALMKEWGGNNQVPPASQLPARKRASGIRQELLARYNEYRLARTPPLRRCREWPAAALALGCPIKVENWPENCKWLISFKRFYTLKSSSANSTLFYT